MLIDISEPTEVLSESMSIKIGILFGSLSRFNSLNPLLNPLCNQKPFLPRSLTPATEMVTESGPPKRFICPNCSKPTQICLCTRLKTPALQNSIAVTILQHSLEKKHPLNSTRIATIGLEDVSVTSVSDVNFQARFFIRLLEPDHNLVSRKLEEKSTDFGKVGSSKRKWDFVEGPVSPSGLGKSRDFGGFSDSAEEKGSACIDFVGDFGEGLDCTSFTKREYSKGRLHSLQGKEELLANNRVHSALNIPLDVKECAGSRRICELEAGSLGKDEDTASFASAEVIPIHNVSRPFSGPNGAASGDAVISFTIGKYGAVKSFYGHWLLSDQCQEKNNVDHLLSSKAVTESLAKGFVVRKLQTKQLNGTVNLEGFEINVPPGSILLFPSDKSVGIEAIDFEVKNLIVLDGTWAKAKRMYNENPWLKLLPHLKLDLDKVSLYNEVRHQPRAGCLSTIESIVYAMKAFGENSDRLDDLLDLFESMVGDQRRCKNERLSRISAEGLNS